MTTDQKIIKNKIGVIGLAKQLGNISQACKRLWDIPETDSIASKNSTIMAVNRL